MFKKAVKLYLREETTFDVLFDDGITKRYDILSIADQYPQILALKDRSLFLKGHLQGWGGIVWNDELDVDSQTVYEEGVIVENNDNTLQAILGFKIKELRLEAQLTQIDVYKECGISQADLSRLEKGQLNPSIQLLDRLAKGLNKELVVDFK